MTINEYLKEWHDRDGYFDFDLHMAEQGDTSRVAEIWAKIESGDLSAAEALLWVQHVAKAVQRDVINGGLNGAERPRAALAAIGFRGTVDRHFRAKEDTKIFVGFFPDATNAELLDFLLARGHMTNMSRKVALTRISEWRSEF